MTAADPAMPIERSPSDVLRLLVAAAVFLGLLLLERFFGESVVTFTSQLLDGVDALPRWVLTSVVVATRLALVLVFWIGLFRSLWHRHFRLIGTVAAAIVVAVLLFVLVDDMLDSVRAALADAQSFVPLLDEGDFPTGSGLAVITASLTAAAPWLSRRGRRFAWALLVGSALSRFITAPISFDTVVALASGWVAGAGVLVALGAPARRASTKAVIEGLTGVGVPLAELEPAAVDARGSTPYFGRTADGTRIFVKVLGEDERSADLMFRLYRRIMPRDLGDEKPFSSLRRAVEHEALVALAARDAGVRTPRLVGFASCEPHSFVLAYEAIEGDSLDRFGPEEITPAVVDQLWEQVGILRRHRIAHRDLRLANLFLGADGAVWLIDFGFSELAASDLLLATDLAELLTSMATVVGPEASVAAGRAAIGDEVATAAPRLKSFALSGATRSAVKARPEVLAGVQRELTGAA